MFFRFGAALMLVVSVALAGSVLETQNLALKRSISRQQFRLQVLLESQTSLRLESQRLGAPARLFDSLERGDGALSRPAKPQRADCRRTSLLNWDRSSTPSATNRGHLQAEEESSGDSNGKTLPSAESASSDSNTSAATRSRNQNPLESFPAR